MGPITLGKVYGRVTLKLLPAMGALPEYPDLEHDIPLDFAGTDSGAIAYPDGHPPEAAALPNYFLSHSSKLKTTPTIKSSGDGKLHRFTSLGFVLQKDDEGTWRKTGHVLVMDMDDKDIRHCQAWFVLAFDWPTDGEETHDGDFVHRARKRVLRPDRSQAGVLPGDNNRTPIRCIIPKADPKPDRDSDKPVLKRFGEGFSFTAARYGGHRRGRISGICFSSIHAPILNTLPSLKHFEAFW